MADIADHANETVALEQACFLSRRKPGGPPAVGTCWFCNAPVAQGLRFCDALCRDDLAAEDAARARNGNA